MLNCSIAFFSSSFIPFNRLLQSGSFKCQLIDSHGWLSGSLVGVDKNLLDFSGHEERPKSLQGIETNNGWIKIESEADLPKPLIGNEYYFIFIEKESGTIFTKYGFTDKTGKYFIDKDTYSVIKYEDMFYKVTHYQPIQKPKPPIY